MRAMVKLLRRDENGAVTVDWVILTAGMVALALGALSMVSGGARTASETLSATIAERPVGE